MTTAAPLLTLPYLYLYRYKKVGTNRYDLDKITYWVCDWSDGAPPLEQVWHTGG